MAVQAVVEPARASILIVEDEAVVALDLQDELERLGYEVVGVADTAGQAIDLARRFRPSLALMDIMLKGEADGVQAAEALRREPGTPVIFLTSFSDADTVARAARSAPYGYLTKPFQIKELRAGIEVALWKSRMEHQLRESDRWFALTLRCVNDGVVVIDEQAGVRFLNPAAEAITGWPAEAALGRPVHEIVRFEPDAAGAPALPSLVQRALAEDQVVGVQHARRLCRRDGAAIAVDESAGPIHGEDGRLLGAVLVLRDAGERLQQESRLRASQQRFRSAFDAAPLGMALVGLDGRLLQVNEALCRLLGRDAPALVGQPQAHFTLTEDTLHEQTRLATLRGGSGTGSGSGTGTVTQFEKRYRLPAGEPVWVLVSASLLADGPGGEPDCYLYQVHDLSAQKAAAVQLAELAAERIRREASELASRSKSEFLSRVSHEMRTPLNAVLGFAQLLKQRERTEQATVQQFADHIVEAGKHLLALVDDVLDLQRAHDGGLRLAMAPLPLADAVAAAVRLLVPMAETRDVQLEQALEPGLAVQADATRMRQVLINLGSNAVKYNLQGGTVVFGARRQAPGRVSLTIEDTGIGMSDEQLEHLFEPFNRLGRESTRVPGVGLGLVITRKLVEQMGGRMAVLRRDGGGTVVALEFAEAAG